MKILHSTLHGCESVQHGGSILVYDEASLFVYSSNISDSSSGDGGAVAIIAANATFSSSSIEGCVSAGMGGAIMASGSARMFPLPVLQSFLHVSDCVLAKNFANIGGALALTEEASAIVQGVLIEKNSASHTGGGLSGTSQSVVDIGSSILRGNSAPSGGALSLTNSSGLIQGTEVSENAATGFGGGGVYMHSSVVEILDNTFTANKADRGGGGALLWQGIAPIVRMVCEPGQYPDAASLGCLSCAAGTYKEGIQASECTGCEAGKYSNRTGAKLESTCIPCSSGKYQEWAGATSCEYDCNAISYSLPGSRRETACHCKAG